MSSRSTPETVLPSQRNRTSAGWGREGPSDTSNLAWMEVWAIWRVEGEREGKGKGGREREGGRKGDKLLYPSQKWLYTCIILYIYTKFASQVVK